MKLINELTDEYGGEPINLCEALEEAVAIMNSRNQSRPGFIKSAMKGAGSFMKKHPAITAAAAVLALDKYSKYKSSQRNTIKLFAKDAYEKKMMTGVVDAMTKSGRYKVVKTKYADGGQYWVVLRK